MSNINKNLYKIFLGCTKYTPITLSVVFVLNLISNRCGIMIPLLSYFGGVSFVFIMLLYLISLVFQFCYLYRIPLYYITAGNIIGIMDKYKLIPLDVLGMYRLYFILTGLAVICYIWLTYKSKHKTRPSES